MPLPHLKVKLDAAGRGTVQLDGHELPGVYAIKLETRADSFTRAHLHLLVGDIDFDGPVHLDSVTAEKPEGSDRAESRLAD